MAMQCYLSRREPLLQHLQQAVQGVILRVRLSFVAPYNNTYAEGIMPFGVRPYQATGTQSPYAPHRVYAIMIPYALPPLAPMIAVYVIPSVYPRNGVSAPVW